MFIVSTILLPLVMSLFGIVPAIILSIDAGSPMRVAVVDQTGKMYEQLKQALFNESTRKHERKRQTTNARPQARGFGNFVLEEVKLRINRPSKFEPTWTSVCTPRRSMAT